MIVSVGQIMTREVVALAPESSLETAARLFSQRHITGAPVVAEDGRAVGVVSRSDLLDPDASVGETPGLPIFYKINEGWAEQLGDVSEVGMGRVSDVMTPMVLSIEQSENIVNAAKLMLNNHVHRLIVTHNEMLVGMLSTMDLLRGFVGEGIEVMQTHASEDLQAKPQICVAR